MKQIFNDDHNENIYFATIPAMIKQGTKVLVVQRIWLGQFEKMKTKYRSEGKKILQIGIPSLIFNWLDFNAKVFYKCSKKIMVVTH